MTDLTDDSLRELIEIEAHLTAAPWIALNMVQEDGSPVTPESMGTYVKNCVLKNAANTDFLFLSGVRADGKDVDVCHIGNGPQGPYNARFMELARTLLPMLARAELHRRAAPASVPAGLPWDVVDDWYNEWLSSGNPNTTQRMLEFVADRAAAYGREQAQQQHSENTRMFAVLFKMLSMSPWPSADQRWAVIQAWAERQSTGAAQC